MRGFFRPRIAFYALLLLIFVVALLYLTYPYRPADAIGVLLFLALLPLWAVGEWVGGKVFGEERGRRMSKRAISFSRIIFALSVFGLIFVAWFFIWQYFGATTEPVVAPHFVKW